MGIETERAREEEEGINVGFFESIIHEHDDVQFGDTLTNDDDEAALIT